MVRTRDGQRWLLATWVAQRVGVSRQAVHKRIKQRNLPTWPINRKEIAVRREDVEAWEAERETASRPGR